MRFLRFVLFCIFFAIGAGSIALSIVAEEVYSLYSSQILVARFEDDNKKITSLSQQYDCQMRLIKSDPNSLDRLKGIMLGEKGASSEDVAVPDVSRRELINASNALLEKMETSAQKTPIVAEWLQRCNQPKSRKILFLAGAALVLISFIFFSSPAATLKRHRAGTKSIDD
jgi:hypothetical protein